MGAVKVSAKGLSRQGARCFVCHLIRVGETRKEPLKSFLGGIKPVHRGQFKGGRGQGHNQGQGARSFLFALFCSLDHNQTEILRILKGLVPVDWKAGSSTRTVVRH